MNHKVKPVFSYKLLCTHGVRNVRVEKPDHIISKMAEMEGKKGDCKFHSSAFKKLIHIKTFQPIIEGVILLLSLDMYISQSTIVLSHMISGKLT